VTDSLIALVEKDQVLDVVNQLFISTDKKDWPAVIRCFADKVFFDMKSVNWWRTADYDSPADCGRVNPGSEGFEGDPSSGGKLPGDHKGGRGRRLLLWDSAALPDEQIRPEYKKVCRQL
jgi:hypothetical protein